MSRLLGMGVIAVTLLGGASASADDTSQQVTARNQAAKEQGPAVAQAVKETDVPLVLRQATPLSLAPEPSSTPWPYKMAFGAALLAAGVVVWKRRRSMGASRSLGHGLRVIARTPLGLRGELALVEVCGMRLVVGLTPSSMQTLAVVPDELFESQEETTADSEREPRNSPANPAVRFDLRERARDLFTSLDLGPGVAAAAGPLTSMFSASRYADERGDLEATAVPAPTGKTRARESDVDRADRQDHGDRAALSARSDRDDDRRRRAPLREVPIEGQARGIALALRTRR